MNLSDYQSKAWEVALYPRSGNNLYYPALGLGGEAGEVLNKVKKVMRDSQDIVNEECRETLKGELGDVLWYVAALATELHLTLEEIAQENIVKLMSRKERGVLSGSGDNR